MGSNPLRCEIRVAFFTLVRSFPPHLRTPLQGAHAVHRHAHLRRVGAGLGGGQGVLDADPHADGAGGGRGGLQSAQHRPAVRHLPGEGPRPRHVHLQLGHFRRLRPGLSRGALRHPHEPLQRGKPHRTVGNPFGCAVPLCQAPCLTQPLSAAPGLARMLLHHWCRRRTGGRLDGRDAERAGAQDDRRGEAQGLRRRDHGPQARRARRGEEPPREAG